jgi:hypothetical protein
MAAAQDSDVDQETQDQGAEDQASSQFQPAGNSVIHWQDTAPADDSEQAAQPEQPEEPEQPRQFQPAGKSVIRWQQPPQEPSAPQPADQAEAQPPSQLAQMFPSIYGAQPTGEPTEERPPKAQPVPGGPVPRARPAAQQSSGLYDFEDPADFVTGKATMFGDQGDLDRYHAAKAQGASDSEAFEVGDNGIGAPRLGGLPTTDLYGAAVPEWVLRSRLGNSPAAWRKARLDIVDPESGQRLRVPIVDIGPSASQEEKGIVADFTPGVDKYFNNKGGGKNLMFRLVKNAGPDVNSDTPDWNNEQAAIASGVDVGQTAKGAQTFQKKGRGGGGPAAPTTVPWTVNWITDEEVAEARRQTQQDKLQALPDEMAALNNLQQQNPNPAAMIKALDQPIKGVSDDTREQFAAHYKQQVTKEAQQFYNEPDPDKALAKATSSAGPVEFAEQVGRQFFAKAGNLDVGLNKFFANTDDAQVNNFVNQLAPDAIPEGKAAFMKHLSSLSPDERAQTIGTLMAGLPPAVQASMNVVGIADAADRLADPQYQAAQKEAIQRKQEFLDKTAKTDPNFKGTPAEWWTDQLASLGVNALTAFIPPPIRNTLWFSQFYSDGKDRLKADHPDWDQGELNSHASASAVVQLASQEALAGLIGGKFGPLTEAIQNPFARAGARALTETGIGAASGGVAQAGSNIAEQRPLLENVPQALAAGAVQGGIPGLVHGAGELRRPAETRAEVTPPPTRGEVEQPLPAPSQPPSARAEAPPSAPPAIDANEFTQPAIRLPDGQVVADWSHSAAWEQAGKPDPNTLTDGYVNKTGQFITVPQREQALGELERARTEQESQRISQEAQTAPVTPPTEPVPEAQGTDKYVSSIANRFVQPKVEAGQIGEIAPGQGYSTKELVNAGLKMSPEEVTQHMSNLMNNVGDPKAQAAAIRAEEARLSQRSAEASKAAEANPGNAQARIEAENAFNDLTDFHNGPVAKLKNNWHAQGVAMQGEIPVDLSTYNGLREAWLRDTGKAPSPTIEPVLRKMAAQVKGALDAETVAMNRLAAEINKSAKTKLPSADDVRNSIMERMKVEPCRT